MRAAVYAAICVAVSGCVDGPAAPAASGGPALTALRACIDRAPDAVCPRPAVQTDSGAAVGSMSAVTAERRCLAREQIAGRAPEGSELDPGVCSDVYGVFALELIESGRARAANADLTGAEAAFVEAQARAARHSAGIDAVGGQAYDEPSVGSTNGESSHTAP